LCRLRRLVQIGDLVVEVFDADRQQHRVFADTGLGQVLCIELAVGGGGRVAGQRLGIADIDQARDSFSVSWNRVPTERPPSMPKVKIPEGRPPRYFCARAWSRCSNSPA
jgi:hypothetical protein